MGDLVMLFNHSIRSLLLLGFAAANASAQSPLWFEKNAPDSVPNAGPCSPPQSSTDSQPSTWIPEIPWNSNLLPAPKSAAWIELNKVDVKALAPAIEPIGKPTPKTISSKVVPAKKESAVKLTANNSLKLMPWSLVTGSEYRNPAASQAVGAAKTTSAGSFVKRAESKLRTQQVMGEQSAIQNQLWFENLYKANEGPKISTQLTSRALQSGETASDFRWPTETHAVPLDPSYVSMAANEAVDASEESLILPTRTTMAIWQAGDAKRKNDKEADTSKKSDEEMTKSKETETAKTAPQKSKFDAGSMVGPLTDPQKLFSMLEVGENFQVYAEPVHSTRSRDLDSQMQAAFTSESYAWISPVFYHKPLYFEQPNLERYGIGTHRWLQPAASSVHFFGSIGLLPYKMLTQHPCEKYYTLGNRRPGNCNPVQRSVILGQSYLGEVREYWRPGSGY